MKTPHLTLVCGTACLVSAFFLLWRIQAEDRNAAFVSPAGQFSRDLPSSQPSLGGYGSIPTQAATMRTKPVRSSRKDTSRIPAPAEAFTYQNSMDSRTDLSPTQAPTMGTKPVQSGQKDASLMSPSTEGIASQDSLGLPTDLSSSRAFPRSLRAVTKDAPFVLPASLVSNSEDTTSGQTALEEGLDKLAAEFSENLEDSALAADSPDYRERFISEAWLNDIRFRTQYGGTLWHSHHVQAYHMQRTKHPAE